MFTPVSRVTLSESDDDIGPADGQNAREPPGFHAEINVNLEVLPDDVLCLKTAHRKHTVQATYRFDDDQNIRLILSQYASQSINHHWINELELVILFKQRIKPD